MSNNVISAGLPESQGVHSSFTSALFDCFAIGIAAVSPARLIVARNEGAKRLTGLRSQDVLNRSIDILPPPLQAVLEETFFNGQPVKQRQILMTQAGGGEDLVQITTSIAHGPGGGVLSVLAEMQSVSQAQSIASNLERLDGLAGLGVLSAGVAHDIKNALVAIRTFVDLAADKLDEPELTTLVSREIRRIDALVRQNLRGAARQEFHLAPMGLHALLTDSANLLGHLLEKRGITLVMSLAGTRDRINGDERQLRHAIMNILVNALEAIDGSGRITIATEIIDRWERPHLRLNITDDGAGIPAEHLPRLFSPFFTTKGDGTGLGLVITRRIIQEHQGAVTVESKAGHGTTFQVLLPLLLPDGLDATALSEHHV
jgi:signal transduction histidine kinase